MADQHTAGRFTIDRLGTGRFKVTTAIFIPGEDRPHIIGQDHFGQHAEALRFVAFVQQGLPFPLTDNAQ
jgi:hypothetical protein